MKIQIQLLKNSFLLSLSLLLLSVSFQGCDKMKVNESYIAKIPIYKTWGEVRDTDIQLADPKEIGRTGKIYLYKDYLFINEPYAGIHIFDNTNPASPKSIGFLPIIGNYDLGIQYDLLYVDNLIDLLTFDISNISKPRLLNRQKNVFSIKYQVGEQERYQLSETDPVPVAYKDSLVTRDYKDEYSPGKEIHIGLDDGYMSSDGGGLNQVGLAGSMARFAIAENMLFAIFQDKVKNFDLQNPRAPKFVNEVNLGFGIETLFPFKKSLFVGANNGMHILDISNPLQPKELVNYSHVVACDPVVVNDNYAFITLRTGTNCGGGSNVLEVVDISDLKYPQQVKVYPMQNPHGLTLAGDYLYLSEGDFGLKSFKISQGNTIELNLVQQLEDIKSRDLIAGPKSLIVMSAESICQFDYSDKANLKQLSCITIQNK